MKTAEEIKKGLEIAVNGCLTCDCCITDCPYGLECHPMNEDTNVDMPKRMAVDALAYIQQLEAQVPKWISVEDERKPKHLQKVLCRYIFIGCEESHVAVLTFFAYGDNGYVTGEHFTDEGMCDMRVTHWMPLPELPKED